MGRLLPKAGDTQGSSSPDDKWLERWKEGWVDWQVHQSMAWCPSSTSLRVFDSRYSRFPSCKHFIGQKYPRYSSQSCPLGKQFDSKPVAIIRFGCPQVLMQGTKMEAIISDFRLWCHHNTCVHHLQSWSSYFSYSQGCLLISLRYEGCRTHHPQTCLLGIRIMLHWLL